MARGRKRKAGRRLPCGKRPREETQREAMSTVLDARRRHYGVAAAQAKDERLGSALGRLSFAGRIGADQFAAGQIYGEIMARNRAVMGLPMDQPRSVTALLINEGIFGGSAPDPDPELVEKVRKQAASLEELEGSPASWFMHWFVTMWMLRFGLLPIFETSLMALMRCAGYFGLDRRVALEHPMPSIRYNKL